MQGVLTRLADFGMRPGDSKLLPLTPSTACLAPGKAALLLAQIPQSHLVVLGVTDLLSGRERGQMF
jgi:hypothetical protein